MGRLEKIRILHADDDQVAFLPEDPDKLLIVAVSLILLRKQGSILIGHLHIPGMITEK